MVNGHPGLDKPCCCQPACRKRFFFPGSQAARLFLIRTWHLGCNRGISTNKKLSDREGEILLDLPESFEDSFCHFSPTVGSGSHVALAQVVPSSIALHLFVSDCLFQSHQTITNVADLGVMCAFGQSELCCYREE